MVPPQLLTLILCMFIGSPGPVNSISQIFFALQPHCDQSWLNLHHHPAPYLVKLPPNLPFSHPFLYCSKSDFSYCSRGPHGVHKEIKPVNPKGNQTWIFIGRTDAEAETQILWPPDAPSLKDFEHNLASMWNECNCMVVWTFFGIAFLWDWNENWPFPVLWPLLSLWSDAYTMCKTDLEVH